MKNVLSLFFAISLLISGCKFFNLNSALSPPSSSPAPSTTLDSSQKFSLSLPLTITNIHTQTSPLNLLNSRDVALLNDEGLEPLDLDINGYIVAWQSPIPKDSNCHELAVFNFPNSMGDSRYVLVTTQGKTFSEALGNASFSYCQPEGFTATTEQGAAAIQTYLGFRGITPSLALTKLPPAVAPKRIFAVRSINSPAFKVIPQVTRKSASHKVVSKKAKTVDTGAAESPPVDRQVFNEIPGATSETSSIKSIDTTLNSTLLRSTSSADFHVNKLEGIAEEKKLGDFLEKKDGEAFDLIEAQSFSTRSSKKGGDLEAEYVELKRETGDDDFLRKATGDPLATGTFASVKKINLDGTEYAVRFENVKESSIGYEGNLPRLAIERHNHLAISEIAKAHPELVFATNRLSFHDKTENVFVTVMPFFEGGNLRKQLSSPQVSQEILALKQRQSKILRSQMEAMRQGVPVKIGEIDYTMEFIHLDIKPENVVLDAHRNPTFVDFGVGQTVYRRKLPSGEIEYKMPSVDKNGEVQLVDLSYPHPNGIGTPKYFSPEMPEAKLSSPEETYKFLRDANAHAYNATLYELNTGRIFIDDHVAGPITTPKEVLTELDNASKNPAFKRSSDSGERKLLDLDEATLEGVRKA